MLDLAWMLHNKGVTGKITFEVSESIQPGVEVTRRSEEPYIDTADLQDSSSFTAN